MLCNCYRSTGGGWNTCTAHSHNSALANCYFSDRYTLAKLDRFWTATAGWYKLTTKVRVPTPNHLGTRNSQNALSFSMWQTKACFSPISVSETDGQSHCQKKAIWDRELPWKAAETRAVHMRWKDLLVSETYLQPKMSVTEHALRWHALWVWSQTECQSAQREHLRVAAGRAPVQAVVRMFHVEQSLSWAATAGWVSYIEWGALGPCALEQCRRARHFSSLLPCTSSNSSHSNLGSGSV